MQDKHSINIFSVLEKLLNALFGKRTLPSVNRIEKAVPENKYFSLTLSELLDQLGTKDGNDTSDGTSEDGSREELEHNPLLDLLGKQPREAEKPDAHEDSYGEARGRWSESDTGRRLAYSEGDGNGLVPEQSDDSRDSISRRSSEKLGHDSAHGRITAKLNSVVSESAVPEHVVFNEIGQATQIIDWRRILRQNSSFEVDWSYRNAVIEDGIVRPSLEAVPTATTEILLDTSGSIDEPLLKRFLQECRNIMPYSKVKIGCFDTRFYGFKEIHTLKNLENMVFEGRHGTSFSAAVGAFSGRADNRIIFTDGDAPMPSVRKDVIWIVFGGKRISPNGGRVFYVDDDLYRRLKADE